MKMKSKIVYLMLCLALVGCGKKNQMPEADNEYAVETVKASEMFLIQQLLRVCRI